MRVSALRGPAARLAPYRLPLLLAVFLVCFLQLLQELPTNPELRLHSARWLGRVLVGDSAQRSPPPVPGPRPGVTLPLPRRHSTTAGGDPKVLVVVMMGECSSCTRFRTAALNDIARSEPGVEVVGAAEVQPGEAARLRKEQGLLFDVVPDPTSRLHRLYMASFTPRVYVLSARGEVLWYQPTQNFTADDLRSRVRALTRSNARAPGARP